MGAGGRGRWIAVGVALVAVFACLYGDVLVGLVRQWWDNDEYSHGFLIPLISLYMIWKGPDGRDPRDSRRGPGLWAAAVAGGLAFAGRATGVALLEQLSLVVALIALAATCAGAGFVRAHAFAFGYLFLMVPFWDLASHRLHEPFQRATTRLAVALMRAMAIPAAGSGIEIRLPGRVLEVAEMCSGVSYLIAVVAVGLALGRLVLGAWRPTVLLVLLGTTIAALANGVRVALMGAVVYWGWSESAHGPYDVLQALAVAVSGYAALFAGLALLSRWRAPRPAEPAVAAPAPTPPGPGLLAVVVALLAVGSVPRWTAPDPVPLEGGLDRFSTRLGGWSGGATEVRHPLHPASEADAELLRLYRNDAGDTLGLYVGYYALQRPGRELIGERTRALHAGAGRLEVELEGGGEIEVGQVEHRAGGRTTLALYWYDLGGGEIATGLYAVKLRSAWDRLFRGRAGGAVAIVTIRFDGEDARLHALDEGRAFVALAFPRLRALLP